MVKAQVSVHHLSHVLTLLKPSRAIHDPFVLPELGYEYNACVPYISRVTMQTHHDKHHGTYVKNLNEVAEEYPKIGRVPITHLIQTLHELPSDIRQKVRNNLGGHVNHSMFWEIMKPGEGQTSKELEKAINSGFGSLDKLKDKFNDEGTKLFGSGWVFIVVTKDGKLSLETKPNQDTPLMDGKKVLFGNDVWEHAYYLDYKNKRDEYLKGWWNLINWDVISERFEAAKTGKLSI